MSIARMLDRHIAEIVPEQFAEFRDKIVAVDVSPAVTWFYSGTEQEIFDFREDFPTIVPPWPYCWLEYKMPAVIHSEGRRLPIPDAGRHRAGLLIHSTRVKEGKEREIILDDLLLKTMQHMAPKAFDPYEHDFRQRRTTCLDAYENDIMAKWMCIMQLAFEPEVDLAFIPVACFGAYLDEQGKPLTDLMVVFGGASAKKLAGANSEGIYSALFPFFFAVSLMHCKNVATVHHDTASFLSKRRHAREPIVTYHTLDINPLRRVLRRDGQDSGSKSEIKRALHICRGHFKDYREKGLFGKRFGIYWWDMQVRGDALVGEVKKDYRVKRGDNG